MATSLLSFICRATARKSSSVDAAENTAADPARNWEERDRERFHRINSDDTRHGVLSVPPRPRAGRRRDGPVCATTFPRHGYGWTAAEIAATGECIGFVGLNASDIAPVAPFGTLEIGWRLAPEFWGHGYVTEAARALLESAFGERFDAKRSFPLPFGTMSARRR